MIQNKTLPITMLVFTLFVSSSAFSDDAIDNLFNMSLSELLDIKVISATKTPLSLKNVPATIAIITAEDIKQRGYESLEDAMRDLPGIDLVDVQGTFPLIWAPRGAYGDENKRTLFLIDGVVENNILEGNVLGGSQYSLHNVERIEFLWGPASALYGANAMSGVINIITRRGRDIKGSEVHLISGKNNTKSIKFLTGDKIDDFEYSFSTSVYDTDGPVFKERNPDYSSSYVDNAYSIVGRLSFKNIDFGYHRYDRPMGYGQFFNSANEYFGVPLFGYNDSEGQAIDDSLSPVDIDGRKGTLWHSITTSVYLDFDHSFDNVTLKERIYYRESEIADDSYAYTLVQGDWAFIPFTHFSDLAGLQLQLDYVTETKDKYILGLDFETRDVEKGYREIFEIQNSPLVFSIGDQRISTKYENRSLFAQYQFMIFNFNNTTYTLGARYDDNSVYGSSFNPRIGVVVSASEKITYKALFATAYRAPNSFDLFTETTVRIANPDLEPEKSKNLELTLGYQASDRMHFETILFYNQLNDMILSNVALGDIDNDGSIETQNQNFGEADIYGIELRSRFSIAQSLKLFLNFSLQDTKIKQFNNPHTDLNEKSNIPNIAKVKSNSGLNWQISDRSSAYIAGRYVGKRSTAQTNPRDYVSGFFVSDLALSYQMTKANAMSITLRINNLFDKKYFDPGIRSANGLNFATQYEHPGINASLKFKVSF